MLYYEILDNKKPNQTALIFKERVTTFVKLTAKVDALAWKLPTLVPVL